MEAEWIALTEAKQAAAKPAQVAPVSQRGRMEGRGNTGGINAATRDLGIERTQAQRSVKIASITPEAKAAARDLGIDDNQTKLLKVAAAAPDLRLARIPE